MNKKGFKDRAVMRKRMVLALWFITAVFGLLIVRLSYIMIVKRDDYSSRAEEQWTSEVRIEARRGIFYRKICSGRARFYKGTGKLCKMCYNGV